MKRTLLIVLAVLILLPAAVLVAAHVFLSSDRLKEEAQGAVERATGRALTIAGPVRLAWSLAPAIDARDVSLANPPGMSRPSMAHLDRVQLQVTLLPLLSGRVEIRRLVLTGPDVLLERDAQGRPNWLFTHAAAAQPAAVQTVSSSSRREFALGALELHDARIAWRSGAASVVLQAPSLTYAPDTNGVHGTIQVNGVPLTLSGTAGPVAGADWPLALDLVGGGIAASLNGTASHANLTVLAPDLAAAGPLAGRQLPPLHDLKATATLSAAGLTAIEASATGPNLTRTHLSAPAPDAPAAFTAELQIGRLPVQVAANAGSLRALLGDGPIPLQLMLASGDAVLSGQGAALDFRGDDLQLGMSGAIPDLARLGDLAGVAVPALRDASIQVRVALTPGGLLLRGLRIASSAGDLAGDLALGLAPLPSVRGTLVAGRVDLDGLALHQPNPPAAPALAAATPPALPPLTSGPLIPDTPLPLAALARFDADLHLTAGEVVWRGVSYHAVDAALTVAGGRLRLDPLTVQGPGGPISGKLAAASSPPSLAVSAQAPGLAAGPVLALLGAPDFSSGTVDLDVQLRGAGDTVRALAATLDGHAGVAMVDGEVDNRWLAGLVAGPLRAANLPVEQTGRSHVRCVAVRADATAGVVTLPALTLDTTKLKLEGQGQLNLVNETLDLHLRPQLSLGALLAVPVHVSGTLRTPKIALDPGVLGSGRVGLTIGGPPAADTCAAALVAARNGRPGPMPQAAAATKPARPADLLRSLLR